MADKGWRRAFEDPIELPDGTELTTLREAGSYLPKAIPKSERDMLAVTNSTNVDLRGRAGDRLDVFRAYRYAAGHPPQKGSGVQPDRKDHHWGKRRLKRDQ